MKYKEFRKYLKGTDFNVVENDVLIEVLPRVYKDGLGSVKIAKDTHGQIMLPLTVEEPKQFELIRKALELAETPISEREDEKKYYLKHKYLSRHLGRYINGGSFVYLNRNEKKPELLVLDSNIGKDEWKTQFTPKEIKELKEKYDTDLKDFELIELED